MSDSTVKRFPAEFKKVPGTISIVDGHLHWTPTEAGKMDRQAQSMARVTNMLASKADAKRTSLKLVFKDDVPPGGLLFTFTSPTQVPDRQFIQDTLIPYVAANRSGVPIATTSSASTPVAGAGTPGTPGPSTPGGIGSPSTLPGSGGTDRKGKRKAIEDLNGSTSRAGKPPVDYSLRRRVLKKNPNLRMLHKELVLGNQITEEEFWEGREAMLHSEEMEAAQRPGRASRLLDDRFDLDAGKKSGISGLGGTGVGVKKKDGDGPVVLNLSKELTREIFEEFPVVQDAYAKHVPGISEAEFWSRYFTSQLWERHRASVRQSASDEFTRKKDDIFDLYLEEPDWNQAPRHAVTENVEKFLDLAATEEDHGDADVIRDPTMQAGRERSSLPLIRRFNEHSNKLLRKGNEQRKSTLSNTILPDDIDIYNEIDLEDLHGPAQDSTIALDVSDDQDAMNGDQGSSAKGILPGKTPEELLALARQESSQIASWRADFTGVSLANPVNIEDRQTGLTPEQQDQVFKFGKQRDGSQAAMMVIKELHTAANLENATSTPFPEQILQQIRSCHNAATEFLRQYWSAVLPTSVSALGAGTNSTSNAVKAKKAQKMAAYLTSTEGKVNAVVHTATIAGVDPDRVRAALAPTVGAVNVALERERKRLAASNGVK